jgi:hypothetical protein
MAPLSEVAHTKPRFATAKLRAMHETYFAPVEVGGFRLNRVTGASIAMLLTRKALYRHAANKARVEAVTIPSAPYTPSKTKPDTSDRTIANMKRLTELRGQEVGGVYFARLGAGDAKWEDIQAYAALVRNAGTGNCLEYAVVAFEKLHADGWKTLELVQLASPSTHSFVILGSARAKGEYAAGFGRGNDVVICDPWAHIACDASAYATEWAAKMSKWTTEKKNIYTPGQTIAPNAYGLQHRQEVLFSIA